MKKSKLKNSFKSKFAIPIMIIIIFVLILGMLLGIMYRNSIISQEQANVLLTSLFTPLIIVLILLVSLSVLWISYLLRKTKKIPVTVIAQYELELQRQKEMFELVINSVPSRIFWKDLNSVYLGCNMSFVQAVGKTRIEDVIGKKDIDLIWAKEAEKFVNDDRKIINTEIKKIKYEESYTLADGKIIWWQTSKVPFKDNNGKIIGILSTSVDITDRKQTEEIIKNQAAKLKATFNAMSDSVSIIDLNGEISQYNAATLSLFNINKEDIKGKKCFELVHGTDEFYSGCPLVKMKESHQSESMIFNQKGYWFEVSVDPIFNSENELIGAVHIVSDITERKKIENDLRFTEVKFHTYMEQASEGIYLFKMKEPISINMPIEEQIKNLHEGYIIEANDSQAKMYGFEKAEELNGMTFSQFYGYKNNLEKLEFVRSWIQANYRITDFQSKKVDKDGNESWFTNDITGYVVDGFLIYIWGTQTNITKKRKADETLKISEEKFRLAITHAPYPIMIHAGGQVLQLSEAWVKQTGYTIDEIPTIKKWSLKAYGDDAVSKEEAIGNLYNLGKPNYNGEWKVKIKDGRTRFWDFSSSPIGKSPNGDKMIISMASDITERKLAQEKIRKYQEHLEDLVKERTKNLEEKNKELERFNDLFVDREFRIKELKEKIIKLENEL